MTTSHSFPGFESPGVGFEQPFELLHACHDRVRRTLTLLDMLVDYVMTQGHDDKSRTAAERVLRYFDLAAPLHHEDEELHVFPPLLDNGDAALRDAVQQLQSDHRRMQVLWAVLRGPLLSLAKAGMDAPLPPESMRVDVANFCALYERHIDLEENTVYPAASARLNEAGLCDMSQQMQARRRH